MSARITRDEIKSVIGVSETAFRRNYVKLLCPPVAKSSDGKGVRNYYDEHALERARWVRKMRDDGYALKEIEAMIARGEAPSCG